MKEKTATECMPKETIEQALENGKADFPTFTIPHKCGKCGVTVDSSVAFTHMRECKGND